MLGTSDTRENNNSETNRDESQADVAVEPKVPVKEIGGPKGLEPTRYGDWERKGRCIDF